MIGSALSGRLERLGLLAWHEIVLEFFGELHSRCDVIQRRTERMKDEQDQNKFSSDIFVPGKICLASFQCTL
jgi:hypothetical protein